MSIGKSAISLTLHLELTLVNLLIILVDMNKPLTCGEGVKLGNELITDMKLGEGIIAYKKKTKYHCDENGLNNDDTILGKGWWTNS